MELGNLIFGNSRGNYELKNRDLVNCKEWKNLMKITQSDGYGYTENKNHKNEYGGYENEIFIIRPYYWGDDENIAILSNFEYKPKNFSIDWYKYPFRDSYMNHNLTDNELKDIFVKCYQSVIK